MPGSLLKPKPLGTERTLRVRSSPTWAIRTRAGKQAKKLRECKNEEGESADDSPTPAVDDSRCPARYPTRSGSRKSYAGADVDEEVASDEDVLAGAARTCRQKGRRGVALRPPRHRVSDKPREKRTSRSGVARAAHSKKSSRVDRSKRTKRTAHPKKSSATRAAHPKKSSATRAELPKKSCRVDRTKRTTHPKKSTQATRVTPAAHPKKSTQVTRVAPAVQPKKSTRVVRATNLKKSSRAVHQGSVSDAGPEPFRCITCPAAFDRASSLAVHKRCHNTQLQLHSCGICAATFALASNLTTHLKMHLRKAHRCAICGAEFTTSDFRAAHQRSHDGEDASSPASGNSSALPPGRAVPCQRAYMAFWCSTCGAAFATSRDLTDHQQSHAEEQHPFRFSGDLLTLMAI